ncbi:MAG: metallophosphoesterase, partial [Thermoleophilia bacterium]|nr:metallophosphoesterase [Thermoleophilia bacterium]
VTSMIIVHAADLHLGSPLGGLDQHDGLDAERIRRAPMRAFERLADLCAERGAGLLVIAGDLFDGDADLPTMREAAQVLERIARAGTQVVTIRGNHDADSRMQHRLPAIEGLHALPSDAPGTIEFPELGVAVHGRGFDTPRVPDNIVASYPPAIAGACNVGVLHTSLAGAPGHDNYAPCTLDDLRAHGYQYWALGHVHGRAVLSDAPWIVYPGNTQGRDVGETGPRGATVLCVADGEVVGEPEHVDLDVVRWHVLELELAEGETADALVARAGRELEAIADPTGTRMDVVRIRVVGRGAAHDELVADPARWRAELHTAAMGVSARGLYLEHVRFRTRPALPPVEELLAREDFIGDAAASLLRSPVEPTSTDAEAFGALERKLAQLPAGSGDQFDRPVGQDELDAARERLLARLLVAHADEVEVAR